MAENSLDPAFVVIEYTTAYGNHKQTIPTLAWSVGIGTNGYGGYVAHDGITAVDALDMLTDLITDMKAFHLPSTSFNLATIYTQASPSARALPQMIVPLGIVGISTATTVHKATQQTWEFRTTAFGRFKIIMLDVPIGANFDKVLHAAFAAEELAVEGALTDLTKAWSGRDNAPPAACVSITTTLNDKLREEYGMT